MKNVIFKEFDIFQNRIHQTYRRTTTREDFEQLQKLERENDFLVLNGGCGTYLFKTQDKDKFLFWSYTEKGSSKEILNTQEAREKADRHYHLPNFEDLIKINNTAMQDIKSEMSVAAATGTEQNNNKNRNK